MSAPDADWWPPKWNDTRGDGLPRAEVIIAGRELHLSDWRGYDGFDQRIYVYDFALRGRHNIVIGKADDLIQLRSFLLSLASQAQSDPRE
jgi:hypothetical protein